MKIETDRLILRPIVSADAPEIFAYSQEPNVGSNAGWAPHQNIQETSEIMKQIFIDQEGVFALVLKENQQLIGSIGLIDDPKRENERAKMIGYAMSERYWGRGLMTEAVTALLHHGFTQMQLELVSAYCYPSNNGSKRVLEKCGFEYEGCLRRCEKRYDGQILDNECYSLMIDLSSPN